MALNQKTDARDRLIDAIEHAQDAWTCCDWRHERRHADGAIVYAADDDCRPVYCEGGNETCARCLEVAEQAQRAIDCGHAAIAAVLDGRLDDAREAIVTAVMIEDSWGDAPVWRPVEQLFVRLLRQRGLSC